MERDEKKKETADNRTSINHRLEDLRTATEDRKRREIWLSIAETEKL